MIPNLPENHRLLSQLAAEPDGFLYCCNPGNAGDSAIAWSTFAAFDQFGCHYTPVTVNVPVETTRGGVVVYAGGGNLVRYYDSARHFIEKHHRTVKRLIVLPHTVDGHEDLLSRLGPNVTIYCRDQRSLAHAQSTARAGMRVEFAHDMALLLDVHALMNGGGRVRPWPLSATGMNSRRLRPVLNHIVRNLTHPGTLNAYRYDAERTKIRIPRSNIDVSDVFATDDMGREESEQVTRAVLHFLNRYDVVNTNRLHVGILSALLGKKVHFYDNAYGKNRSVYEASLATRFPSMTFHSH